MKQQEKKSFDLLTESKEFVIRSIKLYHHRLLSSFAFAAAFMSISSCQQTDVTEVADSRYTIESNIVLNDVWNTSASSQETVISRAGADDLKFLIYLFNSTQALGNSGSAMADIGSTRVFSNHITAPGTYTLYGLTNVAPGEFISMITNPMPVVTTTSTMTLSTENGPNDVCLGSQTLTVTASKFAYSTSVTVSHIMSRLALMVKSVPSDVTSMTITLPSQANVFDFNGTFTYAKDAENADAPVAQTLTLTKATEANTDGTYNWTCPATIVFPCATGTTSMPIQITWGSSTVTSKDVNTTSTTCCLSGKNLSLTTTWSEAYRATASITTADWTAVETATFPW